MPANEIQEALRTCGTGGIDPETALEIYAHLVANISEFVFFSDLSRLIILGQHGRHSRTLSLHLPNQRRSLVDPTTSFLVIPCLFVTRSDWLPHSLCLGVPRRSPSTGK